ncbi:MAG: aconitase family protein [Hyphomonadaceae bacterium]
MAWGIGSSEAEHIMATGVLRARKPPQMRVQINGTLKTGVTAKDVALHLIARFGADGAKRSAIEFGGSAVSGMTVEERLTLCNLAIEFSAYTAIIPPDARTLDYISGRRFSPELDVMANHLASLQPDEGAEYDHALYLEAEDIDPQISWGTNPEESIAVAGRVPSDAGQQALAYMGLHYGKPSG